jgi:hypothetical protein
MVLPRPRFVQSGASLNIDASQQQLVTDPKFYDSAWRIKYSSGSQREKALANFWREVYKEVNHDPQRVFREFALNDYLEASDELHDLEYPMRPNSWSWGSIWKVRHRSSAVTDGPSSLGLSMVGTGSVSGTGLTGTRVASGNPPYTGDAFSLRGGL